MQRIRKNEGGRDRGSFARIKPGRRNREVEREHHVPLGFGCRLSDEMHTATDQQGKANDQQRVKPCRVIWTHS
jgi:hypothetical protein